MIHQIRYVQCDVHGDYIQKTMQIVFELGQVVLEFGCSINDFPLVLLFQCLVTLIRINNLNSRQMEYFHR